MDRVARARGALVPVAIVALAAVLRLWKIDQAAYSPFYDAAVRSMGLSWHNFFFGALEPAASVSVDKAPVDLWLQVAATKLFGFNRTALHLPEALGGTASVALLYAIVRRDFGRLAAAIAALGLALLPMAVLTSRSDTMDSLMVAVLLAAFWASAHALRSGRARWVLVAAGLAGLAFNIKLTQALVPLPALALLWWGVRRGRERIVLAAVAATVLVVASMAWISIASLTPTAQRPYPIGSGNGSIYRVVFVFNGLDRLRGNSNLLAPQLSPSRPGPTRLLRSSSPFYGLRIGVEIVAAVSLAVAALLAAFGWPPWRAPRRREPGELGVGAAVAGGFAVWLFVAAVLFSIMRNLQPRYLETLSPAAPALIGIAVAALLARLRDRRAAALLAGALGLNAIYATYALAHSSKAGIVICLAATAAAFALLFARRLQRRGSAALVAAIVVALFAAPAQASLDLVDHNSTDAPTTGSGAQLSPVLRALGDGNRYEIATTNFYDIAGLIMTDARPVLVLNDVRGILIHLHKLQRLVHAGAVRYILIPHPCTGGRHCPPTTPWSLRHAKLVHRPSLYRFDPGA